MSPATLYSLAGVALFTLGLYALFARSHLLRKILAVNIAGSGVFLVYIAVASRGNPPDPVPQAMVLTGIVVAVSATALALALAVRVRSLTGRSSIDGDGEEE